MSLDFVAIDFETANAYERGSACAIGLSVVKDSQIVESFYSLLDPMIDFSPQCVRVHGIHAEDVVDAPTFPEVWNTLLNIIGRSPIIAHNASFDIPVLERLIHIWELEPIERKYTCTLRLARSLCKGLPSYKLSSLCEYFNLPDYLKHNAEEDARSCALLCLKLAERVGATSMDALLRAARMRWDTLLSNNFEPDEQEAIKCPYIPAPTKCTVDAPNQFACGPIFQGLSFVFTGELASMERHAAEKIVEACAGTVLRTVTRRTNILVVGVQTASNVRVQYSSKHVKALELREKGHSIAIVDESEFLNWLNGKSMCFQRLG